MLPRFARGKFYPKNTEKYVGLSTPTYRSSWEHAFMRLCDEHPNVYKWASESIKIPYRHPFTGKYTVYVPDFFIVYNDKNSKKHAEMVEVKPACADNNGGRWQEHGQEETGINKSCQVGGRKCLCQTEQATIQGSIRRRPIPQRQT